MESGYFLSFFSSFSTRKINNLIRDFDQEVFDFASNKEKMCFFCSVSILATCFIWLRTIGPVYLESDLNEKMRLRDLMVGCCELKIVG